MNLLVVVANPDPGSFTKALADRIAAGIVEGGIHTAEVADLAAEGFDPRMQVCDRAAYRGEASPPEDVLREQARLDRADAIILVFPVYWWSMPALLKGWIDRVFIGGWAFTVDAEGRCRPGLKNRPVHLIAVGADDLAGFERHGSRAAMSAQIERGIFHWCGLTAARIHLLLEVERDTHPPHDRHLRTAYDLGRTVFTNLGGRF